MVVVPDSRARLHRSVDGIKDYSLAWGRWTPSYALAAICFALCMHTTAATPISLDLRHTGHSLANVHSLGSTVALGGNIYDLGVYIATVQISGQPFHVQLDTGSSTLAVPDTSCTTCGNVDPPLSPAPSSTMHCSTQYTFGNSSTQYSCSNSGSGQCSSGACSFSVSYTDGSGVRGFLSSAQLSVGSLTATVPLGRITQEIGQFSGSNNSGIFGIAYPSLNCNPSCFPTPLDVLLEGSSASYQYGICLNSNGGAWDVGGYDTSRNVSALRFLQVPVDPNIGSRTFFYVTLSSVTTGTGANLGRYTAILDSGTTLIVAPSSFLSNFQSRVSSSLPGYSDFFAYDNPCSCLSYSNITLWPNLTFSLSDNAGGSASVTLQPYHYLIPVPSSGVYCLGIQSSARDVVILGDVFMQTSYVTHDLTNNLIGIAPLNTANCPGLPINTASLQLIGPPHGCNATSHGSPPSSSSSNTTLIASLVVVLVVFMAGALFAVWYHRKRHAERLALELELARAPVVLAYENREGAGEYLSSSQSQPQPQPQPPPFEGGVPQGQLFSSAYPTASNYAVSPQNATAAIDYNYSARQQQNAMMVQRPPGTYAQIP